MSKVTISQLLTRGVSEVIIKKHLQLRLRAGKKLRVKFGIDPSGVDLHLGHMVALRKLREFQELGHQVILVVGTFTGQIGDPTGKLEARQAKTEVELQAKAQHYLTQASKMLDISQLELRHNTEWFNTMTFKEVVKLASSFTVQQMLHRDMFQNRLKAGKEIYVHEFLYPLMQGYDSVALAADVEVGGTDQTFNLLAGRVIQAAYNQPPQDILTVPILEGTDGKEKMGKSLGNYIGVTEPAGEMYGKVMSLPDGLILKYFQLCTFVEEKTIKEFSQDLKTGANPRGLKTRLAYEIVGLYHSAAAANQAKEEFDQVFRHKNLPSNMPVVKAPHRLTEVLGFLVNIGLVNTRSEAKRLLEQGAVKIDNQVVSDWQTQINVKPGLIVQVGKRKFTKIG